MQNILRLFAILGLLSCGDNANFSGSAGRAGKNESAGNKTPSPYADAKGNDDPNGDGKSESPDSKSDGNCSTEGKTTLKLLTSSFQNKSLNQHIRYEIGLESCDGKPLPLKSDAILFDVYAGGPNFGDDVSFTIHDKADQDQVLKSGQFKTVRGSDLFGNSSEDYAHWRTDGSIEIKPDSLGIILSIDLSNQEWHATDNLIGGLGSDPSKVFPKEETIRSFFRFGNAQPVEASIKVLNQ